jgi:hypothetical protein
MANLTEDESWTDDLYRIETADPVEGGEAGIDNIQAKQLGRRTRALRGFIDAVFDPTWTSGVPSTTNLKLNGLFVGDISLGNGTGDVVLWGSNVSLSTGGWVQASGVQMQLIFGDFLVEAGDISIYSDSGTELYVSAPVVTVSTNDGAYFAGAGIKVVAVSGQPASFHAEGRKYTFQAVATATDVGYLYAPYEPNGGLVTFHLFGLHVGNTASKYMARVTLLVDAGSTPAQLGSTVVDVLYSAGALAGAEAPTITASFVGGVAIVKAAFAATPSSQVKWSCLAEWRS